MIQLSTKNHYFIAHNQNYDGCVLIRNVSDNCKKYFESFKTITDFRKVKLSVSFS